jgi:glucosyl-dolichyl phosphate glucuronosyltransferase
MAPITVVIPTHERPELLGGCLEALAAQTVGPDGFDVVVIDNGSAQSAEPVCRTARATLPNLRYLHQSKAGLALAKNTGLEDCATDLIAFTDDDAQPAADWLERILRRFAASPEEVAAVGGEVEPVWESERPDWLSDALLHPLSAGLKWSARARPIADGEWIMEVNAAYRAEVLRRCGGFPSHLGRIGALLLSGEGCVDTIIQGLGFSIVYDPQIVVRHLIPAARLTKAWFRSRMFWQGVSDQASNVYVERQLRQLGFDPAPRTARLKVPVTTDAWLRLFDDSADLAAQLKSLQQLGRLLESQGIVLGG